MINSAVPVPASHTKKQRPNRCTPFECIQEKISRDFICMSLDVVYRNRHTTPSINIWKTRFYYCCPMLNKPPMFCSRSRNIFEHAVGRLCVFCKIWTRKARLLQANRKSRKAMNSTTLGVGWIQLKSGFLVFGCVDLGYCHSARGWGCVHCV